MQVEYLMKVIPTRISCRVCPATKVSIDMLQMMEYTLFRTCCQIIFHAEPDHFTLDDGIQEPLTLVSPSREILGATFHKFVLKNIGGSENFQDKRDFFYSRLREHHNIVDHESRGRKRVVVSRKDLLNSVCSVWAPITKTNLWCLLCTQARRAMKDFSPNDWCKKFSIEFRGEEGDFV